MMINKVIKSLEDNDFDVKVIEEIDVIRVIVFDI